MATPAHITAQLNDLAEAKSKELLSRAQTILKKYSNSGELIDSLQVEVTRGSAQEAPVITMTFAEHGSFLDKRTMIWGKVPEMKKMRKWVERKGVESFRYVSGINNPRNLTEEQKINRIASGVAWAYRRHQTVWKRRAWRRQTLVQLLVDLNEKTARIWENQIVIDVEKALETGTP
jgi:hypothetical protein